MKRRVLLPPAALLLVLLVLELGLRVFVPHSALLSPKTDCHWIARLAERASDPNGQEAIRNVVRDPLLGWRMRPGFEDKVERIDARGARRDGELELERAKGTRRLVALGDSFTFGLGVANGETFVDLLPDKIENLQTVNLGVNGFGTDQQLLMFEEHGAQYRPDVVLLGFFVPDFHRNTLTVRELPKPRFDLAEGALVRPTGKLPTPEEVVAERLADCGRGIRIFDLIERIRLLAAGEPTSVLAEKERLLERIVKELEEKVAASGARLGIVVIPAESQSSDHARVEASMTAIADELGVPLLSLSNRIATWSAEGAVFDPEHGHWTRDGHRLAADAIAEFLVASGLL